MKPFPKYERWCRSQNTGKKFSQTTTFLEYHKYKVVSCLLSPHKIILVFSYIECILTAVYSIRNWLSKVPFLKELLIFY